MDEKKLQYISEPAFEISTGALEEANRRIFILCALLAVALISDIARNIWRKRA